MTKVRTFQRTHPWITFKVDLQRAPLKLWMQLGEAGSKCEHLAGVPLRPKTAQALHRLFLAKGALATTAIEGNTLSEREVLQLLDGKLELPKSKAYLATEIDNIVAACRAIAEACIAGKDALTTAVICDFNRQALAGLKHDAGVVPGMIRKDAVVVGSVYRGAPAEDCAYLIDALCAWLAGPTFVAQTEEMKFSFAIIKAVLAHIYLAWIHPFDDGNGRTARLLEFQLLLAAGLPTPAAHLLSNHYNQTRAEYYRQLNHASKSGGDVLPFIEYAVQGLVDGLREQIAMVREQQLDVTWENYAYGQFGQRKSVNDQRQRQMILDLGMAKEFVPITGIPTLSPQLAAAYAQRSDRTLKRDIAELERMLLIERQGDAVRARREIVRAFLPRRKHDEPAGRAAEDP